ncbi:MAG: hypothetical protein JNM76_18365 [Betaproteobacteria bacterium]|nr:hypothetical protein [Betaproteobacteria bacterium]
MKRTTFALATLLVGAGLALGAAAQGGASATPTHKDAPAHGCMHESDKADCPMHAGKHQGGKHHAGPHGKGRHGNGKGCMHGGAKRDAAGMHGCMQMDVKVEEKTGEKK